MVAGMVGGTMSALTGGKFANGAITSAIQWWLINRLHPSPSENRGHPLRETIDIHCNLM